MAVSEAGRIKIAWLCTPIGDPKGGTITHLRQWASLIDREHFEVTLIYYSPWKAEMERSLSLPGLRLWHMPELALFGRAFWVPLTRLYQFLKAERTAVLHTVFVQADILGSAVSLFYRPPVLVSSVEGYLVPKRLDWRKRLFYKTIYRLLHRRFDRIIAISHSTWQDLVQEFGTDPRKIVIIHSGLLLDGASQPAHKKPKQDVPMVGVVARLIPEKGVHCFLQAAPAILEQCGAVRFVVAGDGPERRRLEQLAAELGLGDRVRFLGWVEEVGPLMEELDVLVVPSLPHYDGLPWVVLEGLAKGVPLVASKVAGVPEIVTHGREGLLVEPGDHRALAEAVVALLKDPERAARLAQAGLQHVAAKFSAQREFQQIQELYLTLLKSRQPTTAV